ncbi:MAG: hypothetical protein HY697_00670 [Deltaproteobacteria bacterium]|nr:hypothetical protein [Deltaproteobacteria bacterium]
MESMDNLARGLIESACGNTRWRQKSTINLIPSEHTPSLLVRLLTITDPSGRYAEHQRVDLEPTDTYYYQGTRFIAEVEARLIAEMKKYLGCTQVEVRPISGQMANGIVFSALVEYLNRHNRQAEPRRLRHVLNHHIGRGGHLSAQPMGALRPYVSKDPATGRWAISNFPVLPNDPYRIDLAKVGDIITEHKPEIIVLGKSMIIYREPVREIAAMAASVDPKPIVMYDGAHVLGLFGPHYQQPLAEGADFVSASTHKTFFGTQRGVIGSNIDPGSDLADLWDCVARRAFPGSLSNHHLGTLVGLLMAAYEMNTYGRDYQKQVIANAKAFARALKDKGLHVEGDPNTGYTETHQVLLRVGHARGIELAERLEKNNIIVNYQGLPDDMGFNVSSGLRTGVQEMTRFGMREADFGELAGYFADVILKGKDVSKQVADFRGRFTTMGYCLPEDKARPLVAELTEAIRG